jgi:hypothetical protein
VEKTISTSGKVTVKRDGRTYAVTYTMEGDMVLKTHTETRSVKLSGKNPEDIARREHNRPSRHVRQARRAISDCSTQLVRVLDKRKTAHPVFAASDPKNRVSAIGFS